MLLNHNDYIDQILGYKVPQVTSIVLFGVGVLGLCCMGSGHHGLFIGGSDS